MNVEEKDRFKEEFVNQHMRIAGISPEEAEISETWKEDNPLTNEEYTELIDWGVQEMTELFEMDQTDAEKEISWLVMELGLEYNVQ